MATGSGGPFKVYGPYWRASLGKPIATPLPAPKLPIDAPTALGDRLDDWGLLPTRPNWAAGCEHHWQPGEAGARTRFDEFVTDGLAGYRELRDRPDLRNSSRLSPHLHWGEISPRQIWARLAVDAEKTPKRNGDKKFLSEIGWREFYYHLTYNFTHLQESN